MNIHKLTSRFAGFAALVYLLSALLAFAPGYSEKIADISLLKGEIIICTPDGMKLINVLDGTKKDIPSPSGSHKKHCPLCVLASNTGKIILTSDDLTLPIIWQKNILPESGSESFVLSHHLLSVIPRAPPLSLS